MTIFKSPEYSCLWICNVIETDLTICEPNKYLNETRKTNNVALRQRNHEKNEIDVKITYFNKRKLEKRVIGMTLGQKLTINHPSLVDEEEETRILMTAH
jgi:hypothetical protein